jgi:hypothetical protein
MKERTEPIEVELESGDEVDTGRRGFLKIFGAAAVGTAVAGKGVAEAAKVLAEKSLKVEGLDAEGKAVEEELDSFYRPPDAPVEATEGFSGILEKDTRFEAHPGEEIRVHPWNLVIEYRDWDNVDREFVLPFIGSNIEVEVAADIKYIKALYVVRTQETPEDIPTPTITLRRGYATSERSRQRAGVKESWMGSVDHRPGSRTLTDDDVKRADEAMKRAEAVDEDVIVPDFGYYERKKEERLATNLQRRITGYVNPEAGLLAERGDVPEPRFFSEPGISSKKARRRRKAWEERKRRERRRS